jgi:hypothetical protein
MLGGMSERRRPRRRAPSGPARVALVLLLVAGLLVALSLATRYAAYRAEAGGSGSTQTAAWRAIMRLFDVASERNVPTWFSSSLLLGGALLTGLVASMVRRSGGRDVGRWAGLAVVLALLSLDEAAALHERLRGPAQALLGDAAQDALHFAWVVPGALLAVAVGWLFLGFVIRLPAGIRGLVVAAGAMFAFASIGLEMVGGVVLEAQGDRALYILTTAAEEGLEMAASILFLYAAMRCLHWRPEPDGSDRLALSWQVPSRARARGRLGRLQLTVST